MTGTQLKIS